MSERTTAARLVDLHAPPVVTEVDLAEPTDGEVEVELRFAGVNPLDTYVITGAVGGQAPRPRTLGVEGAGFWRGRPVVVHGGGIGVVRDGTWAGRVLAKPDNLVPVPDGVDLAVAAGAAVVGTTAIRVVQDVGRVDGNDRVLVLGAAGGVGQAVCGLAVAAGAQVWGQTASAGKADAVAEAGATPIVAATSKELIEKAEDAVPTVVFDPLGGAFTTASVEVLAEYGRLVSYGTSASVMTTVNMRQIYRKNLVVAGYGGVNEPPIRIRNGIEQALQALRDKEMVIPVHEVFPLADVGAALRALTERQVVGKVVLDVGAS